MPKNTGPIRLLVVEDSPEDRSLYRRFLSRDPNQSYELLEADSGELALSLVQRQHVDCILLDYRLPDMDGLEILQALTAGRGITPAPVVMLTGFGSDQVDERAMQAGAQDYLVKGQVTELILRRTIRHAIERYRLLAALRENEARTRAILSTAADGIITFDEEGRINSLNLAAEQIFGFRRAEGLGRRIAELIPELHPHPKQPATRRELIGRRCNGSTFPAEVTTSLATPGPPCVFTTIVRDITERKRAEEKFRLAVEASPTAMLMTSRDGRITLANSRTETMFGYPCEELLGQHIEILVPERFRSRHVEQRQSFFAEHRSRPLDASRGIVGLHRSGREFPVEIGLNPLQSEEGEFVLASIVDITERKKAEDRHKLFLAATSHDVRNSLGVILGYVEMLGGSATANGGEGPTTRIHSLVKTLAGMMDDIVVFANLEVSSETSFAPVEVRSVIAECGHFIEKPCALAGLALTVDLPQPGVIETDWVKLVRICQNLLGNAVRYTKQGEIRLAGCLTDEEFSITVRDSGIGIPPDALERIFDPYYRHPTAQRAEPLGTGLGLATVKRFCDLLDAKVLVDSNVGVGTTFTVVVPRHRRSGT